MIVYGFVGSSGTGKSSLALSLCHRLQIHDFIDDGLYIHQKRKVAGTSAKYERNKISAVKRAIFDDTEHLKEVQQALAYYQPKKVMILGTSKKMVQRIASNLGLPEPHEWIQIEDVSTPETIQKALFTRKIHGQHVIPIPRIQVENDRFQQLIRKVKSIFADSKQIGENTIVHPLFQGGRIEIKKSCLKKIILFTLRKNKAVHAVEKISIPLDLYSPIYIEVALTYLKPLPQICQELQLELINIFSQMLSITIPAPHVHVVHVEVAKVASKTSL